MTSSDLAEMSEPPVTFGIGTTLIPHDREVRQPGSTQDL